MSQNNTTVSYPGKHTFTQEEKEQKLQQMLTAMRVKEEIEDELKTTKSTYKAKIDSKDAEIKLISNLLNAGFEDRTFQCILTKDFDNGKRVYTEVGTNRIVGEEPLTAADYQIQMDLDEQAIKANNEAADNIQEDVTEKLEDAGFKVIPIDSIAHLQNEEVPFEESTTNAISLSDIEEISDTIEEPTPTESPEATIETLKTKPLKNAEILIEPTKEELQGDPFSDVTDDDSDPFSFEDI